MIAMAQGVLRSFVILLSALAITAFGVLAMRDFDSETVAHPIESATLDHAARLLDGMPLYSESSSAEPAIMPGLPAASSFFMRQLGTHLWVARGVSLVALLLLACVVGSIVGSECGSLTYALASGSFALLGIGLLGMLPGLARPDAFMLLLVVMGFMALRFTEGLTGAILGGVLLSAGFFVQQQAAWFAAAAYVSLAIESRQRQVAYAITLGVLLGGGYAILSYVLGPWFNFAAWDEPLRALRLSAGSELRFVMGSLLGTLGIFTVTVIFSFALHARPWYGKGGIWLIMGVAAVLAGVTSTTSTQALLPTLVGLSVLGTVSLQKVTRHLAAWSGSERYGGECVVLTALALQFFVLCAAIPMNVWLSLARTVGLVS
jgi:hypothetical protein